MSVWENGSIIPVSACPLLGGTAEYSAIREQSGPAEIIHIGFPESRFRTAETELKLRGGFKASSSAFAQVNKREYNRENRFPQFR